MKTHNALFFIKNVHQLVSAIKEIKSSNFWKGTIDLELKVIVSAKLEHVVKK